MSGSAGKRETNEPARYPYERPVPSPRDVRYRKFTEKRFNRTVEGGLSSLPNRVYRGLLNRPPRVIRQEVREDSVEDGLEENEVLQDNRALPIKQRDEAMGMANDKDGKDKNLLQDQEGRVKEELGDVLPGVDNGNEVKVRVAFAEVPAISNYGDFPNGEQQLANLGDGAVQMEDYLAGNPPQPPRVLRDVEEVILSDSDEEDVEEEFQMRPDMVQAQQDNFSVPQLAKKEYVKIRNTRIYQTDIDRLINNRWLNNNIIDAYLGLICQRNESDQRYFSAYTFDTMFYPRLVERGYNAVMNVTNGTNIFQHNVVFVPIYLEEEKHWVLGVIKMIDRAIEVYDSFHVDRRNILQQLEDYIAAESWNKSGTIVDYTQWTNRQRYDIARQENDVDCGVFLCQFAEFASRQMHPWFTQERMQFYRRRMRYEIVTKTLCPAF